MPRAASLANARVAGYLDGWISTLHSALRSAAALHMVQGLRIGVLRMIVKHADLANNQELYLAALSELERRKVASNGSV